MYSSSFNARDTEKLGIYEILPSSSTKVGNEVIEKLTFIKTKETITMVTLETLKNINKWKNKHTATNTNHGIIFINLQYTHFSQLE